MLGLGGLITDRMVKEVTDDKRIGEMKASRDDLCKLTGQDFGYDLAAWHHFLIKSEAHSVQYTHPYAWYKVRPKILELIKDRTRLRLVRELEQAGE